MKEVGQLERATQAREVKLFREQLGYDYRGDWTEREGNRNIEEELLLKMGYGGSRPEAGQAVGRAGDEGVDGLISEDRLGLDIVYLQAKRWEGSVGRPEIQKFVGALHGKRAKKGVFITSGSFSSEATAYVEYIDPKVVLIDGRRLAELMVDFEVGVPTTRTYHVKRVDSDHFEDA